MDPTRPHPVRSATVRDLSVDLCVIGAGSAGLSVAAGAAQLGLRVALVERDRMGGECLNTGCVPSKALLAAAKAAQSVRDARLFGIDAEPIVEFGRVHAHIRSAISAIAPHDSISRFEEMGVQVIQANARLGSARIVVAGGHEISARRIVLATGSTPAIPPISGLKDVSFLTNETIFENETLPDHLIVLGGGPIGVEIGQAYARLGSAVTIIERAKIMSKDDPELVRILMRSLTKERVAIREGVEVKAVAQRGNSVVVTIEDAGQTQELQGSHLLVVAGRRPRTSGLGLESVGIEYGDDGIVVDRYLRTTARGVYAAGDVVAGPRFTHVCLYHAGVILRNAFFHLPTGLDYRSLPWVTYTDPELAQVGTTEEQARAKLGSRMRVVRVPFAANDRAQTEGRSDGLLKLMADQKGRVVGASIIGAHAGELASFWVMAVRQRLKLTAIAQMIAPYPTWSELNKTAAAEFSKPLLNHRIVRILARVGSILP